MQINDKEFNSQPPTDEHYSIYQHTDGSSYLIPQEIYVNDPNGKPLAGTYVLWAGGATVEQSAQLADDVQLAGKVIVQSGACLDTKVKVGEGAWIGPDSVIERGTRIGSKVRIREAVGIGPNCDIGDGVEIYDEAAIGAKVQIGERSQILLRAEIDDFAKIGALCRIGTESVVCRRAHLNRKVVVMPGVTISEKSVVHNPHGRSDDDSKGYKRVMHDI